MWVAIGSFIGVVLGVSLILLIRWYIDVILERNDLRRKLKDLEK